MNISFSQKLEQKEVRGEGTCHYTSLNGDFLNEALFHYIKDMIK